MFSRQLRNTIEKDDPVTISHGTSQCSSALIYINISKNTFLYAGIRNQQVKTKKIECDPNLKTREKIECILYYKILTSIQSVIFRSLCDRAMVKYVTL
jgi:hypothetical protein